MIDYEFSKQVFVNINRGVCETDAQFCKWLYEKFGKGTYLCIAWRKGRKGFWNFMKVELHENKFRRLKRNPTKEEIELREEIRNTKELERKKKEKSQKARDEIEEEIEDSQEYISEIKDDIKNKKTGCYPYLKSLQPMYSFHSYEDYGIQKKTEEIRVRLG